MTSFGVALLQMSSSGNDQDANLAKGEAFCRRAAGMGADVALFPEMWNIGYGLEGSLQGESLRRWEAQAITPDGPFVAHFKGLARELNMAIALTYLERWHGPPRNSMSLIDRTGQTVMTYAKVHTCDFGKEAVLTPGDAFHVADLDTRGGTIRLGAMICYDREFPESARVLMLKGAEVILTPNACTLDDARVGQFRARAYENMVGVAMTNYAAPQNNGRSVAFDAVTFPEIDSDAVDTTIVEAGEGEGVFVAEFDMDRIRSYRNRETWGNAYRRPRAYGALISTDVEEPFIRPDSRR
jgi:predicted amidohydrolase